MLHRTAELNQRHEPKLPQELERIIFEMAAYSSRKAISTLMLVAHRVRLWLEPILCEIVLLLPAAEMNYTGYSDMPVHIALTAFPPHKQAHHVRHLLLNKSLGQEQTWTEFIPRCYNLQSLAIWTDIPSNGLEVLTSLVRSPMRTLSGGLRRLSASLSDIFPNGEIDFNHEFLKDLTHLDVMDCETEILLGPLGCRGGEGTRNDFGCLKNLRYISFYATSMNSDKIVRLCLEECKSLETLVLFECNSADDTMMVEPLPKLRRKVGLDGKVEEVPEDRVVTLPVPIDGWIDDWFREATGAESHTWSKADKIIARGRL